MDTNICSQWTVYSSKWHITNTQCPLKPAAASTAHDCQGSTFNKVCIDMDISDSPGLLKSANHA